MQKLIKNVKDKELVAKTAVYARNVYGLRSISHVIAGDIANSVKGEAWVRRFINKVVRRPDDMSEIIAYYLKVHGKKLPNPLKRGIADAFGKFDEYQLAKYRGENKAVKLVDIVNLTHPFPTEKNKEALKKLVNGTLVSKDTWEVELSEAGKNVDKKEKSLEDLKSEAWDNLIKEEKLGYLALLRNLRNILENCKDDVVDLAIKQLTNKEKIKKSLVFPFQFTTAYKQIEDVDVDGAKAGDMLTAISDACEISLENVPVLEGKTLVALDCSGSMSGRPSEIASLFAAVLKKVNGSNCDLLSFSDDAQYEKLNTKDTVITIANNMNFRSGGTDFNKIFEVANKPYDRIIILSDMQSWVGYNTPAKYFNVYKAKYDCSPKVISFDLAGLGTLAFPEKADLGK